MQGGRCRACSQSGKWTVGEEAKHTHTWARSSMGEWVVVVVVVVVSMLHESPQ